MDILIDTFMTKEMECMKAYFSTVSCIHYRRKSHGQPEPRVHSFILMDMSEHKAIELCEIDAYGSIGDQLSTGRPESRIPAFWGATKDFC